MPKQRTYVVRVVRLCNPDDPMIEWITEHLRYAGVVALHVHESDSRGVMMCYDIAPPAYVSKNGTKDWALRNAERMSSFRVNAVCAPKWESGDAPVTARNY